MRNGWSGVIAFGLVVTGVAGFAQEPAEGPAQEKERDARPHIQVLKNPYELASFYRSSSGPRPYYYERWAPANDSGLPPGWFRPDLRGRYFRPHWDADWTFFLRDDRHPGRRGPSEGARRGRRDDRRPRPARPRP